MPHLDDDALTLLALGEELPDPAMSAHLEGCDRCSAELRSLRRVVAAGRAGVGTGEPLTSPPPHVWSGIAAAVDGEADRADATAAGTRTGAGSITDLRPRRARRGIPTWLAVAAGLVIGVSGAAAFEALDIGEPTAAEDVLIAAAKLEELGPDGTSGTAEIRDTGDARVLSVRLANGAVGRGFREVWLLEPDTGELVSLGVLNGTASSFELPDDLDLSDYPTVDVSREPLDGDPSHSADSIARGELDL
jgi:hypothetical protein